MTFLPFVGASVLGQRISYIFYFLPTLPSIALATTVLLIHAGLPRVVLVTYGYNHGEPVTRVDADGFVERLDALALD